MQFHTLSPATLSQFRLPWMAALLLLSVVSFGAAAQAVLPAYYSTGSNVFQVTQPSPQVDGSGSVSAGVNATDGNFSTFATLKTDVNVTAGNPVALRLKLTAEAPAGYRAGMVLANASGLLSLNAIGTVKLRTYLTGASPELREEQIVRADLVRAAILATNKPTQLEFTATKSFDAVEIEIQGLVGVNYTTNIYYAYGVRPGMQTRASGYISRFGSPAATDYSTVGRGLVGIFTDVDNPERVADSDLSNYATFRSLLTVAYQPTLRTKLAGMPAGGAPAGYYAGFVVGQAGLLDAGVLSGLRVSTYRNGTLVESFGGTGILELALLPGNKAQVAFPSTQAFDEVQIERTGLITAVDNLQIYYGFGLAPSAFQGINPVLSDFTSPASGTSYSASAPQGAVVNVVVGGIVTGTLNVNVANVDNPQNAADANTNNYAQLNTTGLGLLTGTATASLKLGLNNGSGRAGNRVGMVVNTGSGLLDLTALDRITIATYDANNVLIETKTGSNLLSVSLLGGSTDREKVSFLASRDFSYVEITVNSAASVFSNTRVYYAFAEDVPLISLLFPLPVELTSFTGKWANSATELNWTTASEKNSSYFLVERSVGGDAGYEPVGRVAAAGTSSSPKTYQLRDAEAARLGADVLYYRLRQVDVEGTTAFSPVITVAVGNRLAAAPQFDLYPNPAATAQAVRFDISNLPAGGTIQTYSETGQLVSRTVLTEAGQRVVLPALPAGLYHVVLRDAAGQLVVSKRLAVSGQ